MTWSMCPEHARGFVVIDKDGAEHPLNVPQTTIGFAAALRREEEDGAERTRWWGYRRISMAAPPQDYGNDRTRAEAEVRRG